MFHQNNIQLILEGAAGCTGDGYKNKQLLWELKIISS